MDARYHPGPYQHMDLEGAMGFILACFAWCCLLCMFFPGATRAFVCALVVVVAATVVKVVYPGGTMPEPEPPDLDDVLASLGSHDSVDKPPRLH